MIKADARGDKTLENLLREHHRVRLNPYRQPTRQKPTREATRPPSPPSSLLPSLSDEEPAAATSAAPKPSRSKKPLALSHPSERIDPDLAELFTQMGDNDGTATTSLAPSTSSAAVKTDETKSKTNEDFFASYGL